MTYMQSPEHGPKLQMLMRQIKDVPQLDQEEADKLEVLPKEKLLDIVKIQMAQQVTSIDKMINAPPAANPNEQNIRVIVMQAEDEDAIFEQTGIELANFNVMVLKSKLNEDPEFLQIVQGAQAKIQAIQ